MSGWHKDRVLQKYVRQVQKAIMSFYYIFVLHELIHVFLEVRRFLLGNSPLQQFAVSDLKHTHIFIVKPYGIYGYIN